MLVELLQNIMAFGLRGYFINKVTRNSYAKGDIVRDYIEKNYPTNAMVPAGVLNPLYHIASGGIGTGISLYYTNKSMTKYGLVRDSRKKFFVITAPELLIPKSVIYKMQSKYKYSALITHLIRTGAIKSVLNFFSSEVSKVI